MTYSVTIYCPDQHLVYDGRTPELKGIGGGVTVRIRMARSLARLGHQVTMICNCPREKWTDDVHYIPIGKQGKIDSDIFIASTTGGALDLNPVLSLDITTSIRIVLVGGILIPKGIHEIDFDYLYTPSNFIRRFCENHWNLNAKRIFVSYNGIENSYYERSWPFQPMKRDIYRIVYVGHPNKGLHHAIDVLRLLLKQSSNFELHVFGGEGLWGQDDTFREPEPGIYFHGTVGQKQLVQELMHCSYMISLQNIQEAFGNVVVESMRAGVIVLASPVGAFPEIIQHGRNGFLITGDPASPEVHKRTAGLILALMRNQSWAEYVRDQARSIPWNTVRMAKAWEGHWDWHLYGQEPSGSKELVFLSNCPECTGKLLTLADGYHCIECGLFQTRLDIPTTDS